MMILLLKPIKGFPIKGVILNSETISTHELTHLCSAYRQDLWYFSPGLYFYAVNLIEMCVIVNLFLRHQFSHQHDSCFALCSMRCFQVPTLVVIRSKWSCLSRPCSLWTIQDFFPHNFFLDKDSCDVIVFNFIYSFSIPLHWPPLVKWDISK